MRRDSKTQGSATEYDPTSRPVARVGETSEVEEETLRDWDKEAGGSPGQITDPFDPKK